MAKRYKQFPLFSLPSALINVLANHLTNLLISSLFSVVTLGFYSLVQRMLGIPSALVGQSIGQVFYEEGVRIKHQRGEISELFNRTLKKLLFIGFPLFFTLFWSVKPLFALVWRGLGNCRRVCSNCHSNVFYSLCGDGIEHCLRYVWCFEG